MEFKVGKKVQSVAHILPRDAMHSADYAVARCLSVRSSVRLSVRHTPVFAIAGPTVWNCLPDSLRDPAVGPDQFRRDLKTHLF